MPIPLRRSLLSAFALLLAACGGGGGGAPLVPPGPATLDLELGEFGHRTGAVLSLNTEDPTAGDTAANVERRAVLRFPLGDIPPGATVLSATLRAEETLGPGDVFTTLGGLLLEAVDVGVLLDEEADFTRPPLTGSPIVLSVPPGPPNAVRSVSVTALLQAALQAGLVSLDLRLRPQVPTGTNNDGGDDLRRWNVLAPVAGVAPIVVVTYQP
jgi:hypothetical protein